MHARKLIVLFLSLTGLLIGQTLYTTPAEIYRALIEATAFGALTIINRFEEYGVKVEQVVNCGGIAESREIMSRDFSSTNPSRRFVASVDSFRSIPVGTWELRAISFVS